MMIASHGEKKKSMELKKARESIPCPPRATLGTFGIVREAFKLIWKNKKLISALVLLMFIPYSILTLWNDFLLSFLVNNMYSDEVPFSVGGTCNCSIYGNNLIVIHENFRFFVAHESVFLAAFWLTILVIIVVAIYSSAATYAGTGLTHKKIRETIVSTVNRAAITWLYIFLLLVVCVAIGILAVWVGFSADRGFVFFVTPLILVFMLLYLLLSPIWMLTLVVSIVEQDCFGVAALAEASQLIKGRRIQGSVIMLLLVTISIGLSIAYYISPTLILKLLVASLFCPLKIFTFVVYTVFYYECKKAPGTKVAAAGESMADISPSSDLKTNADNVVA